VLNLDVQNFIDVVQGEHFQIGGRMDGEGEKICVFQRKTGHISETVRDTA